MVVLTENQIKKIIRESVLNLLLEFDLGVIGRSGPITESDMLEPSEEFTEEYNLSQQIRNSGKRVNLEATFGETNAYKVWKNYYTAMMSKPDKKAVGFMSWLHYVCDGKKGQRIMDYTIDGSHLFGFWIDNYFLACYFAPIGYSGMAKLIKGICQYDNIIFAITQDMSPMLERMGVPKADKTHDAPWRGKVVTKDVFGTSQKAIEKGFEILDFAIQKPKHEDILGDKDKLSDLKAKFDKLSPDQQKKVKDKIVSLLNKKGAKSLSDLSL